MQDIIFKSGKIVDNVFIGPVKIWYKKEDVPKNTFWLVLDNIYIYLKKRSLYFSVPNVLMVMKKMQVG